MEILELIDKALRAARILDRLRVHVETGEQDSIGGERTESRDKLEGWTQRVPVRLLALADKYAVNRRGEGMDREDVDRSVRSDGAGSREGIGGGC